MRYRLLLAITLGATLGTSVLAQDTPPPAGQDQTPRSGMRHGGRGMMGMEMGSGIAGTVTEAASDHYTVKTDTGETYTIHYSANTRFMKQPPMRDRSADQGGESSGMRMGRGNPPEPIKATDIKVGDAVMAMGEVDQAAKSVGATMVMQLDPARAKQMEQMRASFGKTWLAGHVEAINDTAITLQSPVDKASHTFVVDENTSFRRRREPVTLSELQVGDNVRVEGAIKNGVFTATQVMVMMPPAHGGPVPRPGPPPQ